MKALREIGWRKALRFVALTLAMVLYRALLFSPLRVWCLRLLGATVGRHVVLHDVQFFNCYRRGFAGLHIGDNCFLGNQCLLDLADEIYLGDHVTLAERVVVLTHRNVGYSDHPLQKHFPPMSAPVRFESGCFVGACATVLGGVTVGSCAFIGAGSVVTKKVPPNHVVAGVPAKTLRVIHEETSTP
jgi:acetyltransferase-like isoleucine patch superfamily enzyme